MVFTLIKGGFESREEEAAALDVLAERTKCLRHALPHARYDQVLFHEGNLDVAARRAVLERVPGARLIDVRSAFVVPPGVRVPGAVARGEAEGSLGYRHMCNFMSTVWFDSLAAYEYAMRVDEDVCLQRFESDPFEAMAARRLVYGYGLETNEEHKETLATLPQWLEEYAQAEGLPPPSAADSKRMYFTNFFVSSPAWWRSTDARRFLAAIAASGNIYAHRWGDAPIQSAALAFYAPKGGVGHIRTSHIHVSTMDRIFADGSQKNGWYDGEMLAHPITRAFHARLLSESGSNGSLCGVNGTNSTHNASSANITNSTCIPPADAASVEDHSAGRDSCDAYNYLITQMGTQERLNFDGACEDTGWEAAAGLNSFFQASCGAVDAMTIDSFYNGLGGCWGVGAGHFLTVYDSTIDSPEPDRTMKFGKCYSFDASFLGGSPSPRCAGGGACGSIMITGSCAHMPPPSPPPSTGVCAEVATETDLRANDPPLWCFQACNGVCSEADAAICDNAYISKEGTNLVKRCAVVGNGRCVTLDTKWQGPCTVTALSPPPPVDACTEVAAAMTQLPAGTWCYQAGGSCATSYYKNARHRIIRMPRASSVVGSRTTASAACATRRGCSVAAFRRRDRWDRFAVARAGPT